MIGFVSFRSIHVDWEIVNWKQNINNVDGLAISTFMGWLFRQTLVNFYSDFPSFDAISNFVKICLAKHMQ